MRISLAWGWQRTCPISTAIRSTVADASSNPPAKRSLRPPNRSIQQGKRSLSPPKRSIHPSNRSLPPAKRSIQPSNRSIPPPNRSIPAGPYPLQITSCLATNPSFSISKPSLIGVLRFAAHLETKECQHWRTLVADRGGKPSNSHQTK